MTKTVVILTEEESAKRFLEGIEQKLIYNNSIEWIIIKHQGKQDLQNRIKSRLNAYNTPNTYFVILHDQDSNDCKVVKETIQKLVTNTSKANCTFIRIACRELESWYFGDLDSVERAYNIDLSRIKNKSKYRSPDNIVNPSDELGKILYGNYQKITGAIRISEYFNVDECSSKSFQMFRDKIRQIANL